MVCKWKKYIVDAATVLKERGAYKIYVLATHGILSKEAPRLIEDSVIDEVRLLNFKANLKLFFWAENSKILFFLLVLCFKPSENCPNLKSIQNMNFWMLTKVGKHLNMV